MIDSDFDDWIDISGVALEAFQQGAWDAAQRNGNRYVRSPGLTLVQPIANCDGSGLYADDGSKDDRRGARLPERCPGCRACK